ncbi:MAG TPA: type II toxin-antitoxin system RelE/ParE family toxin [Candidatus Obscuribacter sp.]|nr:type II toxin-antitoxin system RelE/ParE family toxin [Candidatus Obscuribacter sp.]MBK9281790.1 type II toxin-antitoxin system RelE/ParE family toxin [Candidatus Obscuribacter sp.]HNB16754.1 type II toxin-antitoxin system RelE/ParE family toxin [Candidatus Obscuribacter sp.]
MSQREEKKKLALEYSPNAERNLVEIENYITDKADAKTADGVVDKVLDRCDQLTDMPRSGKVRDEIADGVRSVTSGNFVIYYRIRSDKVEILRVWHGSRDIAALRTELS